MLSYLVNLEQSDGFADSLMLLTSWSMMSATELEELIDESDEVEALVR